MRRAQPADWTMVREVRLAALADAPEAFASTLARELVYPESLWRERIGTWPWFVAFRAAEPVGLVASIPEPSGEAEPATPAAERRLAGEPRATARPRLGWHLVSLWVNPEVRGAGVADLLVGAAVGQARAEAAARVTLWVAVGNARARAFYLRMGFAPTGRQQVYRRAGAADLDEVEYCRDLPGS